MSDIFTWNRAGALGDVVATMNLLSNFRKKHPDSKVIYLCHPTIGQIAKTLIRAAGFDGMNVDNKFFGKEVRLIGYPTKLNVKNPGNHPYEPMKKHLIEYFADELEVEPDFDSFILKRPKFEVKGKYVTIHNKAGWSPYKNWPYERWDDLVRLLTAAKIPTYQIGGPSDPKIQGVTGRISGSNPELSFNTCLSAIANASLHVGIDSWSNHATNIQWFNLDEPIDKKRTKGVILWGSSQSTATGYKTNVNIVKNLTCQPCFKEDPKISSIPLKQCHNPAFQTYSMPRHKCMGDISVKEVFDHIIQLI